MLFDLWLIGAPWLSQTRRSFDPHNKRKAGSDRPEQLVLARAERQASGAYQFETGQTEETG